MNSYQIHQGLRQPTSSSIANKTTPQMQSPSSSLSKTPTHPVEESTNSDHTFQNSVIDMHGKVVTTTPKTSPIADATIQKALKEANLAFTDKNLSLVRELLQNQMPIDKATIQSYLKQMAMFQNASISTLIQMNKLEIPLTQLTTTQFEAYKNGEYKLIDQLNTFSDQLVAEVLTANETPEQGLMIKQIFSTLFPELSTMTEAATSSTLLESATTLLPLDNTLVNANSDVLQDTVIDTNSDISQDSMIAKEATPALKDDSILNLTSSMQEATTKTVQPLPNHTSPVIGADSSLETTPPPLLNKDSMVANESTNAAQLQEELTINSSNDPVFSTVKEFLLKSNFEQTTDFSSLKAAMQDPSFQELFKKHMISRFTLSVKELKTRGISSFYERLSSDFTSLKQLLENEDSTFPELKEHFSKLQENVDFMKTLNSMFLFAQLPVQLSEQTVHSELFVYTKKKQLANDPNNISILLHLDMEHLGPTDVHLSLQQKNLTTKVYTNDESSKSLFQANLPTLMEALQQKGYDMSYEVYQRENNANELHSLLSVTKEHAVQDLKYYSFDSRA